MSKGYHRDLFGFKELAERGDAQGQFIYGFCLANGFGVERNLE
jgi:TPR repeat protein